MAELLFRVEDRVSPGGSITPFHSQRGDVIAICPDGWAWSLNERTAPYWRILRVPGAPDDLQHLVMHDAEPQSLGASPLDVGHAHGRRAFGLDLDHPALNAGDQLWLSDNGRAEPSRTIAPGLFVAMQRRKPRA